MINVIALSLDKLNEQLVDVLDGTVVTRASGTEVYHNARQVGYLLPPPQLASPLAIVYCQSSKDVAATMKVAYQSGLQICVASGRHSSAGYAICDGGIVVDVSHINRVAFDMNVNQTVGSGANFSVIGEVLEKNDVVMSTGLCSSVGVSGWTLGGGYSVFSKLLGMGVDQVQSYKIVLFNGTLVTAERKGQNENLFWGLSGGGHQNFGVVTELTIDVVPLKHVSYCDLIWDMQDDPETAVGVLSYWYNHMYNQGPSTFSVGPTFGQLNQEGNILLDMRSILANDTKGVKEYLESLLEPLLQSYLPLNITCHEAFDITDLETIEDQWYVWFASKYEVEENKRGRYLNPNLKTKKSTIKTMPMSSKGTGKKEEKKELTKLRDDFQMIVDKLLSVRQLQKKNPKIFFYAYMEPYEGKVREKLPTEVAFVHRRTTGDLVIDVFNIKGNKEAYDTATNWLEGVYKDLEETENEIILPFAYQNYATPAYGENEEKLKALNMYYGENLCRLVSVKQEYDPEGIFSYQQGIPLITTGCSDDDDDQK